MQLVPSSAKRPLGRAPVEVYERLAQHDSMSVTGITNTVAAAAALDDTMIPVVSVPEMVDGFSAMDEAGVHPEVSLSAWTRAIDMRPEEYPPVRWPASFRDAEAHLLRQCVHQHSMNDHLRNDVDLECGRVGVPSVVFYHGTILAAAHGIAKAGGFLPGENGHTKSLQGQVLCSSALSRHGYGSSRFEIIRNHMKSFEIIRIHFEAEHHQHY